VDGGECRRVERGRRGGIGHWERVANGKTALTDSVSFIEE
jgi:hypothetical protein